MIRQRPIHPSSLRRLQQRDRRRQSQYRLLFMLIVFGFMAVALVEIGRTFVYSQDVGTFIHTLPQQSPREVKTALEAYATGLDDRNPVIRRAAMTAFKVATAEPFGSNAAAWRAWWEEHKAAWEYVPVVAE